MKTGADPAPAVLRAAAERLGKPAEPALFEEALEHSHLPVLEEKPAFLGQILLRRG